LRKNVIGVQQKSATVGQIRDRDAHGAIEFLVNPLNAAFQLLPQDGALRLAVRRVAIVSIWVLRLCGSTDGAHTN